MADSKISELTALTSAAAADVLPIVDTSATATKKITVTDLFTGAVFNEDGDSVDTRFEGDTKQDLLFIKGSTDKIGINFDSPALRLHVVNDLASSPVYATTQCAVFEDDNRPGIQMAGSANNIGLIDFGDNAASNSGGIVYKHASDSFAFVAAGDEQVTISNGVLGPVTDSDVDLGTSSLYFKDAFIDTITTTGNIKSGGEVQTANIGFTDGDNAIVIVDGGGITASTSLTIAGDGATVTGIKDEDDMSSNSATKLATQQSIKAYVDATSASIGYNLTKTANYTASAGDRILADTSGGAFTITLPASPSAGDKIHVLDAAASFDNNNLTIARNGKKIQSATNDLTITTENTGIGLVFYNDTYGWRILVDAYDVDPTEL
ncbi:phage tail fiber-like protein [uncultured Mediterranean phage uvMED]|nr:phage tail fiber-like protein [uncultured Mediterranean phage uvMED]BAR17861.1 phage tail fiber-like protein [uncultured Mediterranean phage uvMED]